MTLQPVGPTPAQQATARAGTALDQAAASHMLAYQRIGSEGGAEKGVGPVGHGEWQTNLGALSGGQRTLVGVWVHEIHAGTWWDATMRI